LRRPVSIAAMTAKNNATNSTYLEIFIIDSFEIITPSMNKPMLTHCKINFTFPKKLAPIGFPIANEKK
jgi:hypothetical protein